MVAYWGLLLPPEEDLRAHAGAWGGSSSWEEWLLERLAFLEEAFPEAVEVEVWGSGRGARPGWSGWPGCGTGRGGEAACSMSKHCYTEA